MRLPRPSSLRPSVERAPLPATLAGLLLVGLVVQLVLPVTPPLPVIDLPPATRRRIDAPVPTRVVPRPEILRAAIFAPRRGAGVSAASGGGGLSLDGVAMAGGRGLAMISVGGAGQVLRPGTSAGGWRLVAVGRDGATFAGPGGTRRLRVGGTLGGAAMARADGREEGE